MTSRRAGPPPPLHAVVIGQAQPRDHYASSSCWCSPAERLRDLATAAPIYLHGNAPTPAPRPGAVEEAERPAHARSSPAGPQRRS